MNTPSIPYIEDKVQERIRAIENKDYFTAVKIKNKLEKEGVILTDGPQGTRWEMKKS